MIPKQQKYFLSALLALLLAVLTPTKSSHAAANSSLIPAKPNSGPSTPKVPPTARGGKIAKVQGKKSISGGQAPKGGSQQALKAVPKSGSKTVNKAGPVKNAKSAKVSLGTKGKAFKTPKPASKAVGISKGAGAKKTAGKLQAKAGASKLEGSGGKTKLSPKAVKGPGKSPIAKTAKSGTPKPVASTKSEAQTKANAEATEVDTSLDEEESGGLTPILIGLLMTGLGAMGFMQYRRKKAAHSQVPDGQFSETNSPHSTFVSQITATELDSTSMIDAPLSKAERPIKAKITGSAPSSVAKTFKSEAKVAGGNSIPTQKIAASPPRSGAPQQIVQPKKNKPPAAS